MTNEARVSWTVTYTVGGFEVVLTIEGSDLSSVFRDADLALRYIRKRKDREEDQAEALDSH